MSSRGNSGSGPSRGGQRSSSPKMNARQAKALEFRGAPVPKFLQALHQQVNGAQRSSKKPRGDGEEGGAGDLDSLLFGGGSGGGAGGRAGDDEDAEDEGDSEDEWHGAQIVVLKDGKHLDAEAALSAKDEQERKAAEAKGPSASDTLAAKTAKLSSSSGAISTGLAAGGADRSKRRAPIQVSTAPASDQPAPAQSKTASTDELNALSAEQGMSEAKSLIQQSKQKRLHDAEQARTAQEAAAELAEEAQRERKRKSKAESKERKNKEARKEKKKSGKGLSFDVED